MTSPTSEKLAIIHATFHRFKLYGLFVLFLAISPNSAEIDKHTIDHTLSGVYVDNGLNQTIKRRTINKNDKVEVSQEVLEILGLSTRPQQNLFGRLSLRKSAPKFLLDIYMRILGDQNEFYVSPREKRDLHYNNMIPNIDHLPLNDCDTIMTFFNNEHHIDKIRHKANWKLWYNISSIKKEHLLVMAELRFYQDSPSNITYEKNSNFTVSVFISELNNGRRLLKPVSSIDSNFLYRGWLKFNVTETIASWLRSPELDNGFYIKARLKNEQENELKLGDVGLIHPKWRDEAQPFLVAFIRGPELITAQNIHYRLKRGISNARKRKKSEVVNPLLEGYIDNIRSCQMQMLYIDFKDLGWHDWIIAPEGYGAYYCSGECNFPLNAHMNATNHAIVQTLVHLLEPKRVPKPCCAPTRLGALPVLYHLNEENVNLKKYKNMIVKSCGCH